MIDALEGRKKIGGAKRCRGRERRGKRTWWTNNSHTGGETSAIIFNRRNEKRKCNSPFFLSSIFCSPGEESKPAWHSAQPCWGKGKGKKETRYCSSSASRTPRRCGKKSEKRAWSPQSVVGRKKEKKVLHLVRDRKKRRATNTALRERGRREKRLRSKGSTALTVAASSCWKEKRGKRTEQKRREKSFSAAGSHQMKEEGGRHSIEWEKRTCTSESQSGPPRIEKDGDMTSAPKKKRRAVEAPNPSQHPARGGEHEARFT